MTCFWQDLVLSSQVCPGDAPQLPAFESYNVGSGGGFFLFRSSWYGESTNLIDQALTGEADVSLTGYFDGETLVDLDPPVPGYYQSTGYGADPNGDPEDYQCLRFSDMELDAAGLPFNTSVTVVIDFSPPSGITALGEVYAEFGS